MINDLRDKLIMIAKAKRTVSYSEIGMQIGLIVDIMGQKYELYRLLGEVAEFENEKGHPMLTALVIKIKDNQPGKGFYTKAIKFGLLKNHEDEKAKYAFWVKELKKVHDFWK